MAALGINLGFLIFQILNFAIVVILLYKWAYAPIMKMLETRKQKIAQSMEDARIAAEARANAEEEARKIVAKAQAEAADLALTHVDIVGAGQQMIAAQEADAILHVFENAAAKDESLRFGARAQQAHDEICLLQARVACDFCRTRQFSQLVEIEQIHLGYAQ